MFQKILLKRTKLASSEISSQEFSICLIYYESYNNPLNHSVKILTKQTALLQSKKKHNDKAYHDDVWLDHACPFTVRASKKIPVHRVPNVVGVGLAKCGTGTLAFLGKFDQYTSLKSGFRTPVSIVQTILLSIFQIVTQKWSSGRPK